MKQINYQFMVDTAEETRADKFLAERIPDVSRSQIKASIEAGNLLVNGIVTWKAGTKVKPGTHIEISLDQGASGTLMPEMMSLEILFENDDVVVIDKPSGVVVHPGAGNPNSTLVNALLAHCPQIRSVGELDRPGVVHRLDKETSGVLVFAKNQKAYRWLVNQFKSHDTKKTYLALVDGHPPTPTGRIEAPIRRDENVRTKMAVGLRGQGKEAVTEFFQIQSFKQHSFLEVQPITGRTHQIRVHLSYLGMPAVGDMLYGRKRPSIKIDRLFLHAKTLSIRLPGDRVARTFESVIPEELSGILNGLNKTK